ncbi:MAG TPA: hypothetical protein VF382_06570 [Actinomycetota bacterium]
MTTEPRERRSRLSKRALRVWAWIAGGLAFFSPWVALGLSPKPAAQTGAAPKARQVVIVRKITRRVIVQGGAKPAPIRQVTSGSGGGSYSPPTTSTSGSTVP